MEEVMEQSRALANRIKELCKEKDMSQVGLAEACGEPVKRIYRAMAGTMSCQSVLFLVRICKGLDISLDEFFDTDELREVFK
jgi:transcriptional regulator with XRE-family HTH domain